MVIWTERGQHCAPALQDAEVRYWHVILSEEVGSQSGGLGTRGWGSGTHSLAPSTQSPTGGMGEWLKPAVLKTVSPARGSGVRIPLPPPLLAQAESLADWIGRINLVAKRAGERSAGNLPAPFEVVGAGNGVVRPPRQPSTLPFVFRRH